MINRIKHDINGVEFVPINKFEVALNTSFPDVFEEWENDFSTENQIIFPKEGYLELLRHLNTVGVQDMPSYNISIDGEKSSFFVDLSQGVEFEGTQASANVKKLDDKNSVKKLVHAMTFESLYHQGLINESNFQRIPYVVIQDDIGAKMFSITTMIYTIAREIIDRAARVTERIGDLLAGTIPSTGFGVAWPLGNVARYAILIGMDIAVLILLSIALNKLVKQAFELLVPPLRYLKAMTFHDLLTIGLGSINLGYKSSLKSEFKRITVVGVPIDFQKKKFFDMILGEDDRVLNRGYPTSSDTTPTLELLIDEITKMFNISPFLKDGNLILEPKATTDTTPQTTLDDNLTEFKDVRMSLDTSGVWNTKILSYTNDGSDKLLFDNPKGLRVEYQTVSKLTKTPLTMIKGMKDIRFNFALGTVKKETRFDNFLKDLAKISDKLLNTSFTSELSKRDGVLAISQEQFMVTKLLYQVGGKQTKDYLKHIGAGALYEHHKIDESANSVFMNYRGVKTRMDNKKFKSCINSKFVSLEGRKAELQELSYTPENSIAEISYRERNLEWGKNMETVKIYEE